MSTETPIAPEIQQLFDQANAPIKEAIALIEKAETMAELDSDIEGQCHEALEELRGALAAVTGRATTDRGSAAPHDYGASAP